MSATASSATTSCPPQTEVLAGQLADVRLLHGDVQARGWTSEGDRHTRGINRLKGHLATRQRARPPAQPT